MELSPEIRERRLIDGLNITIGFELLGLAATLLLWKHNGLSVAEACLSSICAYTLAAPPFTRMANGEEPWNSST